MGYYCVIEVSAEPRRGENDRNLKKADPKWKSPVREDEMPELVERLLQAANLTFGGEAYSCEFTDPITGESVAANHVLIEHGRMVKVLNELGVDEAQFSSMHEMNLQDFYQQICDEIGIRKKGFF